MTEEDTTDNQSSPLPRPKRREYPATLTAPLSKDAAAVDPAAGVASPASAPATAPADDEQLYDDEFDFGYDHAPEPMWRNPYVLAAAAVVGAVFLAIIVVVIAGRGGSGSGGGGNAVVEPTSDSLTPRPGGVVVESIATSSVRTGPGTEYEVLGTLPRGQKASVNGKDAVDAKWFQITFPQNSGTKGWVPASALKVADINLNALAVVSPTPIARPSTPTSVPQPTQVPTTPTPAITATAEAGPDIAVEMTNSCNAGSAISLAVRNVGNVPISGRSISIAVLVGNDVKSNKSMSISLQPNESVTVPVDEVITAPSTSIEVTLSGSPAETSTANNSDECTVAGGSTPTVVATTPAAATPTRTSTPTVTATP